MILQNRIGADIIMALDDVVRTTITGPRIEEAMYRTLRWVDRCIAGNISNTQCLMLFVLMGLKCTKTSYKFTNVAVSLVHSLVRAC